MNRIIIAILATLLQAVVTTTSAYRLQTTVTPEGAGTVYPDEETCTEGYSVNLSAYGNQGFVFKGWYEGESLLSTSSSFSYTMPARDVVLTARYEFDPEAPADPDPTTTEYFFKVLARPEEAGSFNVDETRQTGGSSMHLYAYTKDGFVFRHWENEKGRILSTNQDFNYVMPNSNTTVYGVFDYNPSPPENPGKNAWNSTTGEVIVDDFTPGYLGYAISNAINGSNRDDVTSIIVSGEISDYDLGFVNDYDNCALLDLSRINGLTEIPSWAFDNTALEKVLLPDCIELIGNRAFSDCQRLSTLTLCSVTPPALGENVFRGVPEGLVVYVPTAAMDRYMSDENWQNFTILPLEGNVRSLTVNLPETADMTAYSKMTLQLTNVDNGQTSSYTTTGKRSYTFGGIPVQTRWTVTMSNQRGDEFGRIENVIVGDEDATVTFTSLKKVGNVSLNVLTPDGENVTDKAIVSWYSHEGAFLAEGTRLNSVPNGEELLYSIKLTGDLRYQYQEQQRIKFVAGDVSTQPSATLQPIPLVNLTGCVKSEYGILSGADVALTQWANGQYSRTATTKTSQDGRFSFTAIDDSSRLVVSSPRFRDVVIQRARFGADADLGTLTMDQVTGIVVVADTRTQAIGSETTFPTVTGNVGYSLYNKTTGREVEDMVVQGRNIIIPSEAKAGDRMMLTVTELSGNYLPVSTDFAIAENDTARVRLIMQELGGIESSFEQSANTENEVLLYDGDGNLYGHADYSAKKATFAHLSAGTYTLVAIGKSLQRGNLLRLADFAKTGMKEGTDYLQAEVAVADGETVAQTFATIPLFDESLFNYTSSDSYVQVNKLSVATGQYVTLSCRAYFKEQYDSAIDNINIIVDLPENCQLIENSLIVGNAASPYTVEEGRVIVPLTREQRAERIRLCVVPTAGGTYRLSTSVLFDYEGERTQSLGSVYFQTSSMTISVPSSTCQKSVLVSGKAPRQATVEVFDNGTLVAQTEALKNGQWKVNCPLTDVYNLSDHRISAKIHEASGLVLQTESKTVTYDREAVEPLDVTMTFYNAWMRKNISVFYNLKEGSSSPSSYSFYHATPITFVANLSNNDPSAVNSVYIHVYTSDEGVTSLKASYDTNLNRWVAVQEFAPGYLPVSVSVSVDYNSSLAFDQEYADEQANDILNELQQSNVLKMTLEELYTELESELGKESIDRKYVDILIGRIVSMENELLGINDELPEPVFKQRVDAVTTLEELFEIINELSIDENNDLEMHSGAELEIPSINLSDGTRSPVIKFVGVGSGQYDSDLTLWYSEFISRFFADGLLTAKFTIGDGGIVTCEKLTGEKMIIDFNGIIESSAEDFVTVDSKQAFLGRVSNYMEHIFNEVDIAQELATRQSSELNLQVARYHYVLKSLSRFGQQANVRITRAFSFSKSWDKLVGIGKQIVKSPYYKSFVRGKLVWDIVSFWNDWMDANADSNEWYEIMEDIDNACIKSNPDPNRHQMLEQMRKERLIEARTLIVCRGIIFGCSKIFKTIPSLSAFGWILSAGDAGMQYLIKKQQDESKQKRREMLEKAEEECCPGRKCLTPPPPPPPKPIPPVQPILDPSGFVYEGVTSNRLEGVTATVFYKAQTEDMYGDIQETVEKWNAEDYGQVNPQITDQEGKYAWDVPQGQWLVKFEKEGYETAYSEWLPVPPPQLDINIAMKQNVQPTVKAARAFEDAVVVEFDKYMMPRHLTTDNISVMQNGVAVAGTVELLDEEAVDEGGNESFASKVRFNAAKPFTGQEVTLTVSNRVRSYADICMQDDHLQTLTVEREIKQIVSDSMKVIPYGETTVLTVSVLPAIASRGKTLTVMTTSTMILGVDSRQVVIGEDGKAEITVSGELPGVAALNFSVEGSDKTASTIASVEQTSNTLVASPTANIASGTVVEKGTAILLSCKSVGATIYYTLDGSCPCNDTPSRKKYDGSPIVINESLTIKAIAVDADMTESDIAEFTYIVEGTGVDDVANNTSVEITPIPVRDKLNVSAGGKIIRSVTVTSTNGVPVRSSYKAATKVTLDVRNMPAGAYIVTVSTELGTFSRKILKVE